MLSNELVLTVDGPGQLRATRKASTYGRTGEASAPTGNRNAQGLRRAGRGCLRLHWREAPPVHREDGLDAEAAQILQPKDPRFPRRLPTAPGAVQGGVRPVVGGDRPPSRNLPSHHTTLEVQGRAAQLGSADDLDLGHIFTEWSVQRETRHELPGSAGSACRSERALRTNAPTRCKVPGREPARPHAAAGAGVQDRTRRRRRRARGMMASSHCSLTAHLLLSLSLCALRVPLFLTACCTSNTFDTLAFVVTRENEVSQWFLNVPASARPTSVVLIKVFGGGSRPRPHLKERQSVRSSMRFSPATSTSRSRLDGKRSPW